MARGFLKLRIDRCKGCEICISICPKKILALDSVEINNNGYHPVSVINEEECIACANCAIMCPDGAIDVYKETV